MSHFDLLLPKIGKIEARRKKFSELNAVTTVLYVGQ